MKSGFTGHPRPSTTGSSTVAFRSGADTFLPHPSQLNESKPKVARESQLFFQ
ncbi:MAG: hypothetical protein HN916_16645 [Anaerolineae bacterium]|nr:hypothetical protein [Anaerolineae bacterium]